MEKDRRHTVLIVDDEETIREYLAEVLRIEGYDCCCFSESLEALSYLAQSGQPADLMLADIGMPGMSGIELLRSVKSRRPEMPVILISGLYELALAVDALQSGADDYLKKPVRPSDVVTVISRHLKPVDRAEKEGAIQHELSEFLKHRGEDPRAQQNLQTVFHHLGFRRYETFQHSKRVAAYARLFGERCGLPEADLGRLELGALLHDIGKIGIPRNVLMKPAGLSAEEWMMMKVHPLIGYRLLAEFPELEKEAELVRSHHENFDGTGYPEGLRGEQIPLFARIFSIVDAFDAITSDRPYREAQTLSAAREEIRRKAGTQFDSRLAEEFLRIPEEALEAVRNRYPDYPAEAGAGEPTSGAAR